MESGCNHLLVKPMQWNDLGALLARLSKPAHST